MRQRRFVRMLAVLEGLAITSQSIATACMPQASNISHVWVHPVGGKNPTPSDDWKEWINDPDHQFRTLQGAIDTMLRWLIVSYHPVTNPEEHGIVYALPGLYGPHGIGSSSDVFPISMRDRVHVVGLGARRCVIRGIGVPNKTVYWPTFPSGLNNVPQVVEVLVEFFHANPATGAPPIIATAPPWFDSGTPGNSPDVAEVLEGFTFEGGDVQVLVNQNATAGTPENRHRISNCVFDMRDNWHIDPSVTTGPVVAGPYIGIYLQKLATAHGAILGYVNQKILIAHNTFVFARWGRVSSELNDWVERSRDEAVGVMDVGNPGCGAGGGADPDDRVRGMANPCLLANVFRTAPSTESVRPYAMIGVGQSDTRILVSGVPVQTNAFAPGRVGSTNGFFHSLPVSSFVVETVAVNTKSDLWNCQLTVSGSCNSLNPGCPASAIPTPAVSIWDGIVGTGVDPAFVGEFLTTDNLTTGVANGYRDWRILPGSPLENLPVTPPQIFSTEALVQYDLGAGSRELLLYSKWDGEHWGNPRIVDGTPDIGFDERHLMIVAGSWSNDSNSHNEPGYLHPNLVVSGLTRQIILPNSAGGVALTAAGSQLQIYVRGEVPVGPPLTGPAWTNPPSTLSSPAILPSLPLYYRTKYIAFDNSVPHGSPQGWTQSLTLPTAGVTGYSPLDGITLQSLGFRRLQIPDDECPPASGCSHNYFNLQGVVYVDPGNVLLRSNLQAELR